MDDALQTYIEESRELLEVMEQSLLALEQTDALDHEQISEALNCIFRAAHTIKGSAGIFSLHDIVAFTHHVENVLDLLRNGKLSMSLELNNVLLTAGDYIRQQVELLAEGETNALRPDPAQEDELVAKLTQYSGSDAAIVEHKTTQLSETLEQTSPLERVENSVQADQWHISLRFNRNSLRDGMDPISFLRFLSSLGDIVSLVCLHHDLPAVYQEFDAEDCYLGFEIGFLSTVTKQQIEDVFEFIREDSEVRIIPPHSELSRYMELIEELSPADHQLRLGEILVRCGSLTEEELERALDIQAEDADKSIGNILLERGSAPKQVIDAAVNKQAAVRGKPASEKSLRVEAERIDHLINLIGELVTAGASTAINARGSKNPLLEESTETLNALIENVRDASMRLRMVEIGITFNRFKRVVRDVSQELGKHVNLTIQGADTELDKTVVEKVVDPLTHLVRNALDHGIETPSQRLEAGKPEQGELLLNAYHDSGNIIIEVTDDGRGLNTEKLRQKAIERNLITPDAQLSEQELFQLIFEPGFSTSASVTNLSGRGVGMDVVRRNINDLGGRIEIDSKLGRGTTLRLYLPLTLAIIDGFLVNIANSPFIVPLDSVRECVELEVSDASRQNGRQYMNLRNEVLPFIRLRDVFQLSDGESHRENVVIVRYGQQKAGLVVDDLLGELQTVIKPMGEIFSNLKGISGSSIMGNGEVALILDVPSLIQMVADQEPRATQLH